MEQTNKLKNSKEVIQLLTSEFPACFTAEGDAKPLKVGIFQDLAERLKDDERVSNTLLRSALRQYTSSWRYLHSVKAGVHRVDLDGNEGEVIEQAHVEHAQKTLKESKERAFANKKPSKAQRPNKADDEKSAARVAKATTPKRAPKVNKPRPKLSPVSQEQLRVGLAVQVLVGKQPMPGQIEEVTKDGIAVKLNSGMLVKVKPEHLVS